MKNKYQQTNTHKMLHRLLACLLLLAVMAGASLPAAAAPMAQEESCSQPFESVSLPLTDMGTGFYTRMDGVATDSQGGLYPGGSNVPPPQHETAGLAAAANILPRNHDGQVDQGRGRVVMISVGMSNTSQEYEAFISLATDDSRTNKRVFLLNGALGGRTAEYWADPNSDVWPELGRRLERYDLSPQQVQVAWIKLTLTKTGDFPDKAIELENDLQTVVQDLKRRFPNLAIVYLSSRTRSYTYWRGLSPEPIAFETGFAVKWLIEKQINGDPALNADPGQGEVKAPVLLWGPYLWADGQNPRSDGFTWQPEDMNKDCTHPSLIGRKKAGQLLLDFLLNDRTAASWFRADGGAGLPAPTAGSTPAVVIATDTKASSTPSNSVATTAPTTVANTEQTPVATQEATAVSVNPTVPTAIDGDSSKLTENPQPSPAGPAVDPLLLAGALGGMLASGLVGFGLGYWWARRR